ncbi:MAG TPA: YhjD/YihY/BrkB family envelope integrity protein [Candidatus Binataceae bacterium]|jgi:membrane protein|nr:YhjD/YihY/BrkB family envelope integrity protein [Candidatus Binataceae bacterium]
MSSAQIRERLISRLRAAGSPAELSRFAGLAEHEPLRTVRVSILGFSRNDDMLWASALTYTSSLALVPILALAFSVLAGLGGADRIRPLIERYLAVNSPEITDALMGFVTNTGSKALGEVGGAVLLVTVILTLGTIEQAFNTIFNVARGRSWLRKFSDYLSVIFTVPLMMVAAVAARTYLLKVLPHVPGAAWGVSTLMMWIAFAFFYVFFPNTRVRLAPAAMGGLVAAILIQAGQWGYVYFQIGAARYHAIYGAMAAVPILLTWIYTAWIIVLYGAELTAALQGMEPSFDIDHRAPGFVRIAALLTVFRAGERMLAHADTKPCTIHGLASELGVSESALRPIVEKLKQGGIVIESADSPTFFDRTQEIFLARDSSTITIAEVLGCLNRAPTVVHGDPRIAAILEGLTAAERDMLGGLTVLDLASGRISRAKNPERVPQEQ